MPSANRTPPGTTSECSSSILVLLSPLSTPSARAVPPLLSPLPPSLLFPCQPSLAYSLHLLPASAAASHAASTLATPPATGRRSPIGHTDMRPGVDRREPHRCQPLPAGHAAIPAHRCAATPLRSPAGGGSERRAVGEEKGGPTSMRSSARPQRAYILMPPCHLGSAAHYPLSKLWRC